jgi:hypothetical protein
MQRGETLVRAYTQALEQIYVINTSDPLYHNKAALHYTNYINTLQQRVQALYSVQQAAPVLHTLHNDYRMQPVLATITTQGAVLLSLLQQLHSDDAPPTHSTQLLKQHLLHAATLQQLFNSQQHQQGGTAALQQQHNKESLLQMLHYAAEYFIENSSWDDWHERIEWLHMQERASSPQQNSLTLLQSTQKSTAITQKSTAATPANYTAAILYVLSKLHQSSLMHKAKQLITSYFAHNDNYSTSHQVPPTNVFHSTLTCMTAISHAASV